MVIKCMYRIEIKVGLIVKIRLIFYRFNEVIFNGDFNNWIFVKEV